jgi:hypothetical protein
VNRHAIDNEDNITKMLNASIQAQLMTW